MSEQLRVSVFVDGPGGEETQVIDEIPRLVASDPGAVTLKVGAAFITINDPAALIATLRLAAL